MQVATRMYQQFPRNCLGCEVETFRECRGGLKKNRRCYVNTSTSAAITIVTTSTEGIKERVTFLEPTSGLKRTVHY